jgi:hypothetical protein
MGNSLVSFAYFPFLSHCPGKPITKYEAKIIQMTLMLLRLRVFRKYDIPLPQKHKITLFHMYVTSQTGQKRPREYII